MNQINKLIFLKLDPLLILGDSLTDHISPAGVIKESSEAGKYLSERQIKNNDLIPLVHEEEIMK